MAPAVIKKLLKDIREFEKDKPEGIKLEINEENIADIQATITGPGAVHHRVEGWGMGGGQFDSPSFCPWQIAPHTRVAASA